MNVHVHFHTLAIDGVFEKTVMGVRFHDAPPPSKDDVGFVEFMARLAALIPPPKIPLVRYHGVFAPRSSWRSLVTPFGFDAA